MHELSLEDCLLDSIDLDQSAFEISLGISVSKPDEIDPRNDPSLRCCGGGDDLPMPYNWAEGASLVRSSDHPQDGETYEQLTCLACRSAHFINPKTGRVLDRGPFRTCAMKD